MDLPVTERTRLRRLPDQGSHRRADLEAVLDAGFVCHLGVVVDGGPMVLPTTYARHGEWLYLHGSVASASLRAAKGGVPVCVTVTHIDGLVIARSVFNHSVNYRCAMVYGTAQVLGAQEREAGLRILVEWVTPGQWDYARRPSTEELAKTMVLRVRLDEASVKISEGPPDDADGADGLLDVWAGHIPLRTVVDPPMPDPALRAGIPFPAHLGAIPARR